MNNIISCLENNKVRILLKKEIYEKEAVLASAYKFTGKCIVLLDCIDENSLSVLFEAKDKCDGDSLKKLAGEFCNEILDQQLRLNLEKKYGSIRELIVKQAFAPIINSD